MHDGKKTKLEAAGWHVTTVDKFIGLDSDELPEGPSTSRRATFTVAIDDGYCEWTYAFGLPTRTSIHDVVEAIANAFGVEAPDGKLTRGYCE